MTSDRSPKPCLHPRANHQHGTYLAYKCDACRCIPCLTAHRSHHKVSRYRTVTGTHSYVPADRAREHVLELLRTLTVGQIQERSGVNRTSIRVLVGDFPGRPPSRRITRATHRALLAVTPDRVGSEQHGLVDGTGTRRRLRALVALGWPAKQIGARLGFSSRTTWQLTRPDVPESQPVRVGTRDAVRRAYDELCLTVPPPSRFRTRAVNIAAANHWPPPLAWDDDIDDPHARPSRGVNRLRTPNRPLDEIAVERALHGDRVHLRPVERVEAVRRLTAAGLSAAQIADRLNVTKRSVQRIRDTQRKTETAA